MEKREFLKLCTCALGATALSGVIKPIHVYSSSPHPSLSQGKLWKWSCEVPYYEVVSNGIRCLVCPNECIIRENGSGSQCRTRVIYEGKLYTISYGNPCAVHADPIEKKPLFHFLPSTTAYSIATAGCNFTCLNCQNWDISQKSPKETVNTDLMPAMVVQECQENACRSIAFTYGEPVTFREYARETARLAHTKGIRSLWISNGYINEKPLRDVAQYLDAATINLKSFSDDIYFRLNGGSLQPVLDTLKTLKEMGVWLEIVNLVVPTWTDKPEMIKQICGWLVKNGFSDTPLHFNRFFPMYKLTNLPYTPLDFLEQSRETAMKEGINFVYVGNVPGTTSINTFCPNCKKAVIERKGHTVIRNQLKAGKCGFCGEMIAGVWN